MTKFLLAVLLVLSAFAVVAHGILVYQSSATTLLMTEEETHDDKPVSKEGKDFGTEKIAFFPGSYKYALSVRTDLSIFPNCFACSKGFYDKPYNPPELI